MSLSWSLAAGVAALLVPSVHAQACTRDLLIDDFVPWTNGVNNIGWPNGDDGSMSAIAASGGQVSFIPKDSNSYFYESFPCQAAVTNGYGGLRYTLQGPAGATHAIELQSTSGCNSNETNYKSSYYVVEGVTGQRQTVTVPFVGFDNDPNYDSIVGLVWAVFSAPNEIWSVGNITLVCGSVDGPPATSVTSRPTALPTSVTTRVATTTTRRTSSTSTATPTPTGCSNLLIDDWASQSRLTFLGYNAMNQPSSDDGTMANVIVNNGRLMLTPMNRDSYFYSQFGCLDTRGRYGGISMRIKANRGVSFAVTVAWTDTCGSNELKSFTRTTAQLNWVFDGQERLYWFPFSVFTGVDTTKLDMIYLSQFTNSVVIGPMAFFCGSTGTEYVPPTLTLPTKPRETVPAPSSNAKPFVIDTFANQDTNALGEWHGGDEGMTVTYGRNMITLRTNDSDLSWNTQLTSQCFDMTPYTGAYLHIAYSGSNKFSVAMQQHNSNCDDKIAPYPETWDSLEAARYATTTDIYIPISHFHIEHKRSIGFNLRGFYTQEATQISKIEIVSSVPRGFTIPSKLPSGKLVFACKRPNSFAFAIDDGDPKYAQRVMDLIKKENIPVTFFTVGLPLLVESTNLSAVYKDMAARGHQIALHSYTHPKMEGLPDIQSIDWEYNNDIGAVKQVFGDAGHSNYFRPPFGTEGARMRQRLVETLGDENAHLVGWSIDIEDWIWAESDTPEKQLDAYKRDLAKGGNLLVMHYLYESTVELLPEFIRLAKASGKTLMRVDQCMEDPNAPPL